jgi:hypothetical protein
MFREPFSNRFRLVGDTLFQRCPSIPPTLFIQQGKLLIVIVCIAEPCLIWEVIHRLFLWIQPPQDGENIFHVEVFSPRLQPLSIVFWFWHYGHVSQRDNLDIDMDNYVWPSTVSHGNLFLSGSALYVLSSSWEL